MQHREEFDHLVSEWDARLESYHSTYCDYNKAYSDALSECKFELQELLDNIDIQENIQGLPPKEVQEIIDGWKADEYLSSIEAHDLKYA